MDRIIKSPAAPHSDPAGRPAGLLARGRWVSGAPGCSWPLYPARVRRGEGEAAGLPLSGPQILSGAGKGWDWAIPKVCAWGILAWVLLQPGSEDPGKRVGSTQIPALHNDGS